MIVRPLLLELSLVQTPLRRSLVHHMLDSYHRALHDVVLAQLQEDKRHADGLAGMLQLLQDVPIVRVALKHRAAQALAQHIEAGQIEADDSDLMGAFMRRATEEARVQQERYEFEMRTRTGAANGAQQGSGSVWSACSHSSSTRSEADAGAAGSDDVAVNLLPQQFTTCAASDDAAEDAPG